MTTEANLSRMPTSENFWPFTINRVRGSVRAWHRNQRGFLGSTAESAGVFFGMQRARCRAS